MINDYNFTLRWDSGTCLKNNIELRAGGGGLVTGEFGKIGTAMGNRLLDAEEAVVRTNANADMTHIAWNQC